MTIVKCTECGKELSDKAKLCPNCGTPINEETPITSVPEKCEKKSHNKLLLILLTVVCVVLTVITGITVRIIDGKTLTTGEVKLSSLRNELSSVSTKLSTSKAELSKIKAQIESQKKKIKPVKDIYNVSLAAGTYTVGTDLEPGIYHFTYNLKDPEDTWGDYIYVTFANSEGSDKTLGGTKFDYRTEADIDGEQVSIKLDAGSKVTVEAEYGNWDPGKQPIVEAEN